MSAYIPYGVYWSTPFAKWQGSLAHLNALPLAAAVGKQALAARGFDMAQIDLAILGLTNPQKGSFYGLPSLLFGILKNCGIQYSFFHSLQRIRNRIHAYHQHLTF